MASPHSTKYRIEKKTTKTLNNVLNPHSKEKSGTRKTQSRRLGEPNIALRTAIHRRGCDSTSIEDKRKKMNRKEVEEIVESIINKQEPSNLINKYDRETLASISNDLMQTTLNGWEQKESGFHNGSLVMPLNEWSLKDGHLTHNHYGNLDNDYLYTIYSMATANSQLLQESQSSESIDTNKLADVLANAGAAIKKLNDAQVHDYIIQSSQSPNPGALREILKNNEPSWKVIDCDIDVTNSVIILTLTVKYTKDGTQNGIIEENIEVKIQPSLTVQSLNPEITPEDSINEDEPQLDDGSAELEPESEEPDVEKDMAAKNFSDELDKELENLDLG